MGKIKAEREDQKLLQENKSRINLSCTRMYGDGGNVWSNSTLQDISSVQLSRSVMSDSLQPHALKHARLPCPSPTPGACSNSCPSSSVMPSNHLNLCHPLFLLSSIFPSIRVFSSESVLCIRWPKYWSFSFSISPSNEHSGPISRIDWFDLLAVPGTLKNLLQHHSSFKEQASFNFMAAVTIYSDFGAQANKVYHCFHCFPIYLL